MGCYLTNDSLAKKSQKSIHFGRYYSGRVLRAGGIKSVVANGKKEIDVISHLAASGW